MRSVIMQYYTSCCCLRSEIERRGKKDGGRERAVATFVLSGLRLKHEIVQRAAEEAQIWRGRKRERERVVFVCLFFVHVRKTSVGMFILKLQYVQVFTYRMLTIKYYILRVMLMRHDTFCTTFSLFEQRFVPIKCQTSGKKKN